MYSSPMFSMLLHIAAVAAAEAYSAEKGCDAAPKDFAQPPMTSRALFRYWLPDASVSVATVRQDILNITATGAGGVEFLPFYLYGLASGGDPPTDWAEYGFGSPAFREIFQAAVEATYDAKGTFDFSAANQGQGVPAPANTRGLAVQLLLGKASLKAGQTFDGAVPSPQHIPDILSTGLGFQHQLEVFGPQKLVATIAIEITAIELGSNSTLPSYKVNVDSTEDLTDTVIDGQLTWTAPVGNTTWQVLSFYEAFTNQKSCAGVPNATTVIGNGSWTLDHFSQDGAALLTDFFDEQVFPKEDTRQRLSLLNGNVWEDSMEMLATLWWTPEFLSTFENRLGYSLVKYLPFLYIADNQWGQFFPSYLETYFDDRQPADAINQYVLDYRKVLNEGYQKYIQHMVDWAHLRGFKYSNQPAYNLPLDMSSDIPLLDTPETESLGFQDNVDSYRAFSGPANLAGAQQISNELGAIRTFPYTLTVPNLLWSVKRAFAGGCNRMVFHGSPYSGNYVNTTWPGYNSFGYRFTEMWNIIQPCWAHLRDAMDFVGRTQHILQSGVAKVDLAFYDFEAPFTIGVKYDSRNLLELGYTYNFLGPDNFQLPLATVEDQILAPTGPAYKALIFNNQTILPESAISTISMFANAGLPVVFVTQVPNRASTAVKAQQKQADETLDTLLSSLPNVQFLASVDDLPQALSKVGILPRVQLECGESTVYTVWRHTKVQDYLFLYNDHTQPIDCAATITTPGNTTPYINDAWTGASQQLLEYTRLSAEKLQVPIRLAGNATQIISLIATPQRSTTNSVTSRSGEVRSLRAKHGSTVIAAVAGSARITTSDGRELSFDEPVPAPTNLDTWDIEIQDWHGPTDPARRFDVLTEIDTTRLDRKLLAVWSSYGEQYRNVSGIGIYTTTFTTPEVPRLMTSSSKKLGAFLKLPLVEHTLRIKFNSKELPPIDPLTPTVDLSAHLCPPGRTNTIVIEIATTLFNRLLSEIDTLQFIGVPLSKLEPAFVNATRFEYGLVGPVELEWASLVEFEL